MKKPVALAFAASAVCAAGLWLVLSSGNASDAPVEGNFALERLSTPNVELIDQNAERHRLKGALTDGRLLVINFSYTLCNSICPIGNDVMAELDGMLPPGEEVRLLSITIDPGRDTPAMMRKAADAFGASERWLWLTGAPGEIDRLLEAFDADFVDLELHDPVFLIGDLESGRFYRSLSMPSADELRNLVATLGT
ncbi:SCO family protein [Rubrimonas cliftonensis]|uniref:Protein SCO1/2 n=1 Tax=Rubrimonas cliftonensis TaxID=89524 RepID=A0A1H4EGY0_9RHOB|nr:SCO family protein [Rubrimonas cliftonensis]SEA84331.1 protein SCO1/2 [Rubrimonas cliftonensis]